MAANIIGGSLPFGSGGASMDFSGSPQGLQSSYANAYSSSLAMNKQNYDNILRGYQQTAGAQDAAQQGVASGYAGLSGSVLGGIQGVGQSQAQAIKDQYAHLSGAASQGLIDRGLGNTTVANSVQRGLSLDQAKANVGLANSMAQLTAGYQSQLGLAGLGYQADAARANTGQANRQLDWMNSVNAGYPNAGLYGQLAQQYGAARQGDADRDLARQGLAQLRGAGQVPARGTTSYSPGGTGGALGGPLPGTFAPGGGTGSALGGGGATYAYPGNYLGLGAEQAAGGYDDGYLHYEDDPGSGLAGSLGRAAGMGGNVYGQLADPAAFWNSVAGGYGGMGSDYLSYEE